MVGLIAIGGGGVLGVLGFGDRVMRLGAGNWELGVLVVAGDGRGDSSEWWGQLGEVGLRRKLGRGSVGSGFYNVIVRWRGRAVTDADE